MAKWKVVCDDIVHFCENYEGEPFHAALTDPPYHLTATKRWGDTESYSQGQSDVGKRFSTGFMGKKWDGGDIAYRPETWAALARLCHPGAFGMAFGSSRGWHRLAVAIEDAGMRIHPSVFMLGWSFGSGFPKATRIDTQIDRIAGIEREVVGRKHHPTSKDRTGNKSPYQADDCHLDANFDITAPSTPLARTWEGHRYGLQAMKPALEPTIVWQKPYGGKSVECITETGAGALRIDGGRISVSEQDPLTKAVYRGSNPGEAGKTMGNGWANQGEDVPMWSGKGRWPSNFALVHHPECVRRGTRKVKQQSGSVKGTESSHTGDENTTCYGEYDCVPFQRYADTEGQETVADWDCHPDCPVRKLGEQSGISKSTGGRSGHTGAYEGGYKREYYGDMTLGLGDKGTAARFFHQSDWSLEILERLECTNPVFYTAKAQKWEREAGLHETPLKTRNRVNPGGLEHDPKWSPVERHNPHPTVKPISLCHWLATLLLPPSEYAPRRLLVPFGGVCSEAIGAMLAGWDEIVIVEMSEEYCEIGEARMQWWSQFSSIGEAKARYDAVMRGTREQERLREQGQLSLL